MQVSGARTIRAEPRTVWEFLMTPDRLRGCLPGCERFEATAPDVFEGALRLGIGFLKGTYSGSLRVLDAKPHESFRLEVQGGGALGRLTGSGTIRLVDTGAGSTYFLYEGTAKVGGRVAALGETIIEATATRLIAAFFDCVVSKVGRGPNH
jgi:uncharacterized protein